MVTRGQRFGCLDDPQVSPGRRIKEMGCVGKINKPNMVRPSQGPLKPLPQIAPVFVVGLNERNPCRNGTSQKIENEQDTNF